MSVSLLGNCPAASKGKDRIAECKIVLDGSSLSPARDLILFLSSTTGKWSGVEAW
jgi:hypothetical protein